jgi:hypothetical protein
MGDVAVFSGHVTVDPANVPSLNGPCLCVAPCLGGAETPFDALHGSQFNVRTGAVLRGPATDPLKTCRVTVDGEVGRVDVPLALAVQSE